MAPEQFVRDLALGYAELSKPRLNDDYLAQLFDIFHDIVKQKPPQNADAYGTLLAVSLTALRDFTKAVNPVLLQQSAIAPFYTVQTFADLSPATSPFEALAKPFKDNAAKLSWLYNSLNDGPLLGYEGPRWRNYEYDTPAERREADRRYEKDVKEYEKFSDKVFKNAHPLELTLTGTPFFRFWSKLEPLAPIRVPFDIPPERWFEGCWIVAPQGSGKTNLLRHLILNRLQDDATIIVMDAKGNLLDTFKRLRNLKDRLILLEPSAEHPVAMNPLAIGDNELLKYLFSVFSTEMTSMQSVLSRELLRLLALIPNATLEDYWRLLNHGWKGRYDEYVARLPERSRTFFEKDFSNASYRQRASEIDSRIRRIIDHPILGPTFSVFQNKIPMREWLDSGKLILIDNNYDRLGEEGAEFFGRVFLALIWYAARAKNRTKPVYVFVDEADTTIRRDQQINRMITQLRSPKVSLTFAHQGLYQIKDADVLGALSLCAIKFTSASGEAAEMARFIEADPAMLKSLEVGQFATWVKGVTKQAPVVLNVREHKVNKPVETLKDTAAYPLMDDHEFEAFRRTMHARYSIDPGYEPPHAPAATPDALVQNEQQDIGNSADLTWVRTLSPKLARKGGKYRLPVKDDQHQPKQIEITIPPNTPDGFKMRVRGYGAFDAHGHRGDLYLVLRVPAHPGTNHPARANQAIPTRGGEHAEDW